MVVELFERMRVAAGIDPQQSPEGDALIGFFQTFRPDGRGLESIFDELPSGNQLHRRLDQLFAVAGDDRRPQGGRDAYFVVRGLQPIEPERVRELANQWLANLRQLAIELGNPVVAAELDPSPAVRVLEGLPPKHPKREEEKASLLKAFQQSIPQLVERIEPKCEYAELLRQAYYFIHCDAMLRDYLMWPLYADSVEVRDPFESYFELWRHGVKYRIFQSAQIDFYIPRVVAS